MLASRNFNTGLSSDEQKERANDIARYSKDIVYSKRYNDATHEYRYDWLANW
jgi:hypothetical protein